MRDVTGTLFVHSSPTRSGWHEPGEVDHSGDYKAYSECRSTLETLKLDGSGWTTSEIFKDGPALYAAVCNLGLEGVVAKKLTNRYEPGERGWIKSKNPSYWRRDAAEPEAIA